MLVVISSYSGCTSAYPVCTAASEEVEAEFLSVTTVSKQITEHHPA